MGYTDCVEYEDLNRDLLKDFAEGSPALERLLNTCYDHQVRTIACCRGHGENGEPYIMFRIPKEHHLVMENMINALLSREELKKYVTVEISSSEINENCSVTIRLNDMNEQLKEESFDLMQETISNVMDKNINQADSLEGVLNLYQEKNQDNNIYFIINQEGISIRNIQDGYRLVEIDFIKKENIQSTLGGNTSGFSK